MAVFLVKAMLQDVDSEEIYNEFDEAMADENGFAYTTGPDGRIYALPADEFEFDIDGSADNLLKTVVEICARIEKKHNLSKTPIVVVEPSVMKFANLLDCTDELEAEEN